MKPVHHHGDLVCMFCGKHQDDVAVLIINPHDTSTICDICIEQAMGAVLDHLRRTKEK